MESLLDAGVKQGDALQGEWPWADAPELVLTNPPGCESRTDLEGWRTEANSEKNWVSASKTHRQRTTPIFHDAGNVNLYRLFIERSLQILKDNGRLRIIAPDSLLASNPLIRSENSWSTATVGRMRGPSKKQICCSQA